MLNLNSVMISTMEPEALASFYAKVFDKPADMEDADNGFHGWQAGAGFLGVLRHSAMVGKAITVSYTHLKVEGHPQALPCLAESASGEKR